MINIIIMMSVCGTVFVCNLLLRHGNTLLLIPKRNLLLLLLHRLPASTRTSWHFKLNLKISCLSASIRRSSVLTITPRQDYFSRRVHSAHPFRARIGSTTPGSGMRNVKNGIPNPLVNPRVLHSQGDERMKERMLVKCVRDPTISIGLQWVPGRN